MKKHTYKGLQQIVGLNIVELRKKQNMLQKDLARRLGMKTRDFSLIESGSSDISISMLEKIAIVFKVPVEVFLFPHTISKNSNDIFITKAKLLDTINKQKLDVIFNLLDIFIDSRIVQHH